MGVKGPMVYLARVVCMVGMRTMGISQVVALGPCGHGYELWVSVPGFCGPPCGSSWA